MATPAPDLMRRHRYTVADYLRMGEAGILGEDDRIELIEGEIIDMPPIGSRHSGTVNYLAAVFADLGHGRFVVSGQNPVVLDPHSSPQPDLAVLRARRDYYTGSHPGPGDVLLIVEVAESSQRYDREIKMPLYARHGIPEAWLVDLEAKTLTIFRDPTPEGYRSEDEATDLQRVVPALLPDLRLDLGELFAL